MGALQQGGPEPLLTLVADAWPPSPRGHVPGFLGGFDAPIDAAALDHLFDAATTSHGERPFFCCFSWGDADREFRRLPYVLPPPLAGEAMQKPWAGGARLASHGVVGAA